MLRRKLRFWGRYVFDILQLTDDLSSSSISESGARVPDLTHAGGIRSNQLFEGTFRDEYIVIWLEGLYRKDGIKVYYY